MKKKRALAAAEHLERSIYLVRGQKVMLDSDLAGLYGVETFRLNEAVGRNSERFPEDFMFQLNREEVGNLIFQSGISSSLDEDNQEVTNLISQFAISSLNDKHNQYVGSHGGKRKLPFAFTEQGIAMLSSVLRSSRAIEMNIAIMRAFVALRGMMRSQENIQQELAALKRQYKDHDDQIKAIFLMIDEIMAPPPAQPKRKIGFL